MTMTTKMAAAVLAGALALSPGLALAHDDQQSLEQFAVGMAETPEQHAALASHYRAKAEEARAEAARHDAMKATYGKEPGKQTGVQRSRAQEHCAKLSKHYGEVASEYDGLANLQDEQAK